MAKKDKKKSKKKDTPGADAVGAVRTAVERTFQATADSAQSTRTRAQDLVDEVAHAAARVREMIEQIGVLEDLKRLRAEVESLARRVAALETASKPAARKATASKPATRKPAARKPAARKRAARKQPTRKAAASRAKAKPSASSTKPSSSSGPARPSPPRRARPRRVRRRRSPALRLVLLRLCRHPQVDPPHVGRQEALLMANPRFDSPEEFRTVIDQIFTMMSEDPEMGPALEDADVPQRFEFDDLDMVVNIRAGEGGEGNLHWEWSDDVDWKPKVKMTMSSETANKYFQGKENVAVAIARRRIKTGGDVKAALSLIPITKPVYARYRDLVEAEYPHLKA